MKKLTTRTLAVLAIADVLDKHRSLNDVLPNYRNKCANETEAAFFQALVFGVLRFYPRLQSIAKPFLKKSFQPKDEILNSVIALGVFQLTELHSPEYAAVSETVEVCRQLQKPWATGVINAVLREFQRQQQDVLTKAKKNPAWFAHPDWLLMRIKSAWPNHWQQILEANNIEAPMVLRVNTRVMQRDDYLKQLQQHQISAVALGFPETALRLQHPCDVRTLPGFQEGAFSVQDPASQAAVYFLDLQPGLKILDACAAPGGKATHILEFMNSSDLLAVDIEKTRTEKIKENLQRLQLKAKVITEDVQNLPKSVPLQFFDRILLDAPCSATGVIRRHPDIKYLRRNEDIENLASQQLKLLQTLWPLLKPGGILLYATCSILPEENEQVIEKFLNYQKDAETLSHALLGFTQSLGVSLPFGLQILPGQNEMDGFYYARIRKKV